MVEGRSKGVDLGILDLIKWLFIILIVVAVVISIATAGDYTTMKDAITDVGRSFLALMWGLCDVMIIMFKGADTAQVVAKGGEIVTLLLAFLGHLLSLVMTAFEVIMKGVSEMKL